MKVCTFCNKEFTNSNYNVKLCSDECRKKSRRKSMRKYYEREVVPKLPGPRKLKTEEEKKETQKKYNNSPERRKYMKEYRKPEFRKEKERASGRKWYQKNKKVEKNSHLKRKFGVTLEEYNIMYKNQNKACAICLKPETKIFSKTGKVCDLAVDHCHKTGKVRGLLCWNCNTSLGKFKDSVENLERAIKYLKK